MAFSVKPHLPLITPRIEFQFKILPPTPPISLRRDFGIHLRQTLARARFVPYRKRGNTPFRAADEERDTHDLDPGSPTVSELTDLSSDDEHELSTIPKPPGEVGRITSGGYNLQQVLDWDDERYHAFIKFVNDQITKKLDITQCYSNQNKEVIQTIIESVSRKFGTQGVYTGDWHVRDALKLRLKQMRDASRKKSIKVGVEGLKGALTKGPSCSK